MSANQTDDEKCALCGDFNARRNWVCNGCGARLPWADEEEAKARAAKTQAEQKAEEKTTDTDLEKTPPHNRTSKPFLLSLRTFCFGGLPSVWLLRLWALGATIVLIYGTVAQGWFGEHFSQLPLPYIAFSVVIWRLYGRRLWAGIAANVGLWWLVAALFFGSIGGNADQFWGQWPNFIGAALGIGIGIVVLPFSLLCLFSWRSWSFGL